MTTPVVTPTEPNVSDGKKTAATDTSPGTGDGETMPPAATPPVTPAVTPPVTPAGSTRSFTQEEVNALLGKTRQESRDRAVAGLLEDLKLSDVDSLKKVVGDADAQRLAQMTELEQIKEEANRLTPFEQQAADQAKAIKKYEEAVGATVESLMGSLEVPDHVKPLLENMPPLERLAYLTEHGDAFAKEGAKPPATNVSDKGTGANGAGAIERNKKVRHKYGIQ